MTWFRLLPSLIALCLGAGPGVAKPPPNPDPTLAPWFQSLVDPETSLSCCEETDCRPVDHRLAADHYEVLIGGAWVAVPEGKIIRGMHNPTGRAVLCWSPALGIMCFVPGPGV